MSDRYRPRSKNTGKNEQRRPCPNNTDQDRAECRENKVVYIPGEPGIISQSMNRIYRAKSTLHNFCRVDFCPVFTFSCETPTNLVQLRLHGQGKTKDNPYKLVPKKQKTKTKKGTNVIPTNSLNDNFVFFFSRIGLSKITSSRK